MGKWIRLSEKLPPEGIYVWVLRKWNHHTGGTRQQVRLAERRYGMPLKIDDDISKNCYWYGRYGSNFSDATVWGWRPLVPPKAPKIADAVFVDGGTP